MLESLLSNPILSPAVVGGAIAALLVLERAFPLRERVERFARRLPINVAMSLLTFGVGSLAVKTVGLGMADWASRHQFGLLYWLGLPTGAGLAVGFLLMDLTFYGWHRLNHEVPWLWRFHSAHHVDPDLDLTTAFRFHPGEVFYSSGFRVVQVGLIGASPLLYVGYELVFTVATAFHHTNWRLPIRVERWLNWIVVTPRMHGIHHSVVREETNSNYATVFRWWDWLARTLRLHVPQQAITIGVPGLARERDNRLLPLLALPFRAERDDWHGADGESPSREERSAGGPLLA